MHQITILFGDRGLPASYRHMNGYESHTLILLSTPISGIPLTGTKFDRTATIPSPKLAFSN